MIDIHCHILPGIDDGSPAMGESIAMAEVAAADGITRIVATPHIREEMLPLEFIARKVEELNQELRQREIPVEILAGGDVDILLDPGAVRGYGVNGTAYMLVEFPHEYLPSMSGQLLFGYAVRGITPIITHPERNGSVIANPDKVRAFVDAGSLVQVTADSLAGTFGVEIKDCACHLVREGLVHIIASDAHSSTYRAPILSHGLRVAEGLLGAEAAGMLVKANPEAVVQGLPLDV